MAKLRTSTDELRTRIRELTEEIRLLRQDMAIGTRHRVAMNGMAQDKRKPVGSRHKKARREK